MTEDCTTRDIRDIKKCLIELIALAKEKWGVEHLLEKAGYEKLRCTKCHILYFSWNKEAIMATECKSWEDKLKKMI